MRKLIAGINMTLDGFCDHTGMIADDEVHQHFTDMLNDGGTILYGRITYQLMESYWPMIIKEPTGNKDTDDFAAAIQNIPKIVFSNTYKKNPIKFAWDNTTLATGDLEDEVKSLKNQSGKDILVGSPGLISDLISLNLVDELHLCVHPVIAGSGLPLFKNITERSVLKLFKTKTFGSGALVLYYELPKNL
ncbi:MAG: dihydrofolate reductase family protein [Cyclobacteriaceae bacterium]|nr:dihydrofolate reductase family protein [Cyclobacteriaceae bacterium]